MIHYHGLPATPEIAAVPLLQAGHAFVSYAHLQQFSLALELCQSFAVDNGAFSAWRSGKPIEDWKPFYEWADDVRRWPTCDFVVIPDVIDGDEAANDALVDACPLPASLAAPVWHMHESLARLCRLAAAFPRVCLGSSGEFSKVGSDAWWDRMRLAIFSLSDAKGRPRCKLHGLRMLNPSVFSRLPLASADSTNVARNIGIDVAWTGSYKPIGKPARAATLRQRIEAHNAPPHWDFK